jgi:hypothetical protein
MAGKKRKMTDAEAEDEPIYLNGKSRAFLQEFYSMKEKLDSHLEAAKNQDHRLDSTLDTLSGLKIDMAVAKKTFEGLAEKDNLIVGLLISLILAFVGAVLFFIFAPQ